MAEKAKPKGKARRVSGKEKVEGGRKGEAAARARHGTQMGARSQRRQPDATERTSPTVPKKSSTRMYGGGGGGGSGRG
jgi:hypothetical protein